MHVTFTREYIIEAMFKVSRVNVKAERVVVSFAAVIRVVTRHATLLSTKWGVSGEERCVTSDDPNNGCEGD